MQLKEAENKPRKSSKLARGYRPNVKLH